MIFLCLFLNLSKFMASSVFCGNKSHGIVGFFVEKFSLIVYHLLPSWVSFFTERKMSLSTFRPVFSLYFPYFPVVFLFFFFPSYWINVSCSSSSPFRLELYWDHSCSSHLHMQFLCSQSGGREMSTVSQTNLRHCRLCNGIGTFSAVESSPFYAHPNGLFALLRCGAQSWGLMLTLLLSWCC